MTPWKLYLLIFLIPVGMNAQDDFIEKLNQYENHGEVYFSIEKSVLNDWEKLPAGFSFDFFSNDNRAFFYARKDVLISSNLGNSKLLIELLPHPSTLHVPAMKDKVDITSEKDWDYYPTYNAYLDMMNQFELNYPELCHVQSIGQSVEGREILALVISDNIGVSEGEAQVLYTSSIHGDETAGYVLFLRLIDYMLDNYGVDDKVTQMVDNLEIWINPLSNPDGTYASGNNTVFGATRFNANGVDLNRNYPDPEDGEHPDGNDWQQETILFMELAESNNFVLSMNCHGGNEVFNYPWDTWPQLPADDDWWNLVGREWADTVHVHAPANYFDGFDNGVTNGYQWYSISGGRQDYMNYFHHCREVTLEISNTKLLPESMLGDFWEYNYRSFLNYIRQAQFGIHGKITEAGSGEALKASVVIENHDVDESWITSNNLGYYYRLIFEGSYDLTFFRPGYSIVTVEDVEVSNYTSTELNVELIPTGSGIGDNDFGDRFFVHNSGNGYVLLKYLGHEHVNINLTVHDLNGRLIHQDFVSFSENYQPYKLSIEQGRGMYFLRLFSDENSSVFKILIN